MPSLSSISPRFEVPLTVIEGGSGVFHALIVEVSQNTQTATVFTDPRQLIRVRAPSAARAGMVVRTPAGEVFILANNGVSELSEGTVWESFKLFKATKQVQWRRRTKIVDPVTLLETEGDPQDMGLIWAAIEPMTREAIERRLHVNVEQAQFIVGANVQRDDTLDGRPATRSDEMLGIRIGVLT